MNASLLSPRAGTLSRVAAAIAALGLTMMAVTAAAQAPAAPAVPSTDSTAPKPDPGAADAASRSTETPPTLASMQWLEGCWQGSVAKREFREVWLPQRGGMMIGVSQTVMADKTLDYEYLRLEPRGDAVYYVVSPPNKPEEAFKLTSELVDKEDAHTFVFADPARDFPQRIGYRRASEGWLYTEVEGKVSGADRKVVYPMRRVDCATGEFIRK